MSSLGMSYLERALDGDPASARQFCKYAARGLKSGDMRKDVADALAELLMKGATGESLDDAFGLKWEGRIGRKQRSPIETEFIVDAAALAMINGHAKSKKQAAAFVAKLLNRSEKSIERIIYNSDNKRRIESRLRNIPPSPSWKEWVDDRASEMLEFIRQT